MKFNSQAGQDKFAYRVLVEGMGIQRGTFAEIGTNAPIEKNNTYVFEKELGWAGVLNDMDAVCIQLAAEHRTSPMIAGDCTKIDWRAEWRKHFPKGHIDFLSLDVDQATLATLKVLPLDEFSISLIVAEHDFYRFGPGPRDEMFKILIDHGYTCVCPSVIDNGCEFEFWWVDTRFVPTSAYSKFITLTPTDWKEIVNR